MPMLPMLGGGGKASTAPTTEAWLPNGHAPCPRAGPPQPAALSAPSAAGSAQEGSRGRGVERPGLLVIGVAFLTGALPRKRVAGG